MKAILTEVEFMNEYTKLVSEQINNGKIMKVNRGSNSMYENETHFYPDDNKNESLIVAIERLTTKSKLDLRRLWMTEIFALVIKNVKHTFDEGEVFYSQTVIKFETEKRNTSGKRIAFYVTDLDVAREIGRKRSKRANYTWMSKLQTEFNPTPEFTEKLRSVKGFNNAKPNKLKVIRVGYEKEYRIVNTALQSEPSYIVNF